MYTSNRIRYVDLDEDEIFHWKYIKRNKLPNGKWRYYYDESNLTKAKYKADQSEAQIGQNYANMINAQKAYGAAQTAKAVASNRYNNLVNSGKASYSEVRSAKDAYNVASHRDKTAKRHATAATRKYNNSVEKTEKLIKQYERKKIISFPRRAISIGVVAAANWINDNRPVRKNKT